MSTGETIINVDLTNEQGEEIGRTIPVAVEYATHVDGSYGEDADGRRGTVLIEREILDLHIAVADLMTMNSAQVEQALTSAREIFSDRMRRGL